MENQKYVILEPVKKQFKTLNNPHLCYLDHNATCPPALDVVEKIPQWLQHWGNCSSTHWASRGPKFLLREARKEAAQALHVKATELVFTSSASESNATVLKGVAEWLHLSEEAKAKSRAHLPETLKWRHEIISTRVEHPSVQANLQSLQALYPQLKVHFLEVNREGEINLQQYEELLSEKTALVSIMHSNNETGDSFSFT